MVDREVGPTHAERFGRKPEGPTQSWMWWEEELTQPWTWREEGITQP